MAGGSYLVETTKTELMAPHERTEFWSEHVNAYHCRLDYDYPLTSGFNGGTVRQRTDTYQNVLFWSGEIGYIRTPKQVRQAPDEDYRFVLPLTGELVIRQDERESRLPPGAGSLFTLGAPFDLVQESDACAFILTIPAGEVDGPLNRSSPLAAGLDLSSGLGRVVNDMMTGLFEERDSLTSGQFDAVCDRMVELLCMLVVGDDRPDAPGHLAEVEAMVRRYVREHAADGELTCAALAQELGWSLRQIQLALQRVGTTPSELIREERLRSARERLRSPAYQHMSITDLAYASGFSSASALSTAFRRRFGMTPREARNERDAD
ncbi:AraC family transcriptional regulator [Allosalinactinospora lopnorensis]|uniref:AraC family transcriptional regulator n=1 Tax=Allosalinactinospora lopnorensis TaxID=1352348 RepID=UPI000623DC92|nr:AraC family transcriptional regulator [Allosalinactinospora lopnorensis]